MHSPGAKPADPGRSFLLRLPATLLVGMLAWLLLRPALDVAVPGLSEVLLRSVEFPRVTRLVPAEHSVEVRRSDFRAGSGIPALPLTEVHFNTIVLLALLLALPRPFERRQLERLFMGWSVLLLSQAVNLSFEVKCLYATRLGEWSLAHYSGLARNFYGFFKYFTDLPGRFGAPFVIWVGFNWDVVRELLGEAVEQEPVSAPDRKGAKKRKGAKR